MALANSVVDVAMNAQASSLSSALLLLLVAVAAVLGLLARPALGRAR